MKLRSENVRTLNRATNETWKHWSHATGHRSCCHYLPELIIRSMVMWQIEIDQYCIQRLFGPAVFVTNWNRSVPYPDIFWAYRFLKVSVCMFYWHSKLPPWWELRAPKYSISNAFGEACLDLLKRCFIYSIRKQLRHSSHIQQGSGIGVLKP